MSFPSQPRLRSSLVPCDVVTLPFNLVIAPVYFHMSTKVLAARSGIAAGTPLQTLSHFYILISCYTDIQHDEALILDSSRSSRPAFSLSIGVSIIDTLLQLAVIAESFTESSSSHINLCLASEPGARLYYTSVITRQLGQIGGIDYPATSICCQAHDWSQE